MGVWPQGGQLGTTMPFAAAEAATERKHERALVGEQVEAQAESTEILRSELAELRSAYEQIGETLEQARVDAAQRVEQWGKKVIEIESLLLGFTGQRSGSAGGVVRLPGTKMAGLPTPEEPSKGWPSATGDIRLTHNNAPAGWLAIGDQRRVVRRDDYKELSSVLLGTYGSAPSPRCFLLPAKFDLTNDPAILDNPNIRFIIRT